MPRGKMIKTAAIFVHRDHMSVDLGKSLRCSELEHHCPSKVVHPA